jgi:hypothetical protein
VRKLVWHFWFPKCSFDNTFHSYGGKTKKKKNKEGEEVSEKRGGGGERAKEET